MSRPNETFLILYFADIIFLSLYSGIDQPYLKYFSSSSKPSNSVHLEEEEDNFITAEIFSLFPHFLFPPSSGLNKKIPLALASHSPAIHNDNEDDGDIIGGPQRSEPQDVRVLVAGDRDDSNYPRTHFGTRDKDEDHDDVGDNDGDEYDEDVDGDDYDV